MNCPALLAPAESIGPLLPIRPTGRALDRRMAADGRGAEERLEIEKLRAVDQARDHFAHVVGLAIVDGHDPEQLLGIVKRRGRAGARRG